MATETFSKKSADRKQKETKPENRKNNEKEENAETLIETMGSCKWFNITKGYGFITPDSSTENKPKDIFVYQSTIQMPGYRSLKQGEKVHVWYKTSSQGFEAVKVCGLSGGDCEGNNRKSIRRKKPDRCFNCGEKGHHAKECSLQPLPKRCHQCKSFKHLVADCPQKRALPNHNDNSDSNDVTPSTVPLNFSAASTASS